jgi:hypothetical protein
VPLPAQAIRIVHHGVGTAVTSADRSGVSAADVAPTCMREGSQLREAQMHCAGCIESASLTNWQRFFAGERNDIQI